MYLKRYSSFILFVIATCCIQGCNTNGQRENSTLCKDYHCEEGECSVINEQATCVDKDPCTNNKDCTGKRICDSTTNKCVENICNTQTNQCARGICDPLSKTQPAACISKDPCDTNRDCSNKNDICNGSHKCVSLSSECTAQKCGGTLVCESSGENSIGITCHEKDGACKNKLDCLGTRICNSSFHCEDRTARCSNDVVDPEVSSEKIIRIRQSNQLVTEHGILCGADVDPFTIEIDSPPELGKVDKLRVTISMEPRDVGIGKFHVKLLNGVGNQVVAKELPQITGTSTETEVTLEATLSNGSHKFTLLVEGDPEALSAIHYNISAIQVTEKTVEMCEKATLLTENTPLSGSTLSAPLGTTLSHTLKSSCGDALGTSDEAIYRFVIDKTSFVTVNVENNSYALNLSVRKDCLADNSELGCVNNKYDNTLSYSNVLEPGTYYAIVQGANPSMRDDFTISYSSVETTCTPGEILSCDSSNILHQCNLSGTGTIDIKCAGNCVADVDTGITSCEGPKGDHCDTAPFIKEGKHIFNINFADLKNNLSTVNNNKCIPTVGKDFAVRIEGKKGTELFAKLESNSNVDATLYLIKGDCSDLDNQCLEQKTKRGSLLFNYTLPEDGIYYLIADSTTTSNANAKATLEVDLGLVSCIAGEARCNGKKLEVCRDSGYGFSTSRVCDSMCDAIDKKCISEQNDSCNQAKDISGQTDTIGYIEDYTNQYTTAKSDPSKSCAGKQTKGNDAYFVYTPTKNELLQITFKSEFKGQLVVTDGCDIDASTCLKSLENIQSSYEGTTTQLLAEKDKTLYLTVDAETQRERGKFTIHIETQDLQCTPGETTCDPNNTSILKICQNNGQGWSDHTCSGGGCSQGECPTKDGNTCHTPIPLDSSKVASAAGETIVVTFDSNDTNHFELGDGIDGGCNFAKQNNVSRTPIGPDKFYSVTVPQGKVLEVSYASPSLTETTLASTLLYLMSDCVQGSCVKSLAPNNFGKLYYYNDTGSDFKGILVFDHFVDHVASNHIKFTARTYDPECTRANEPIECTDSDTKVKWCKEDYTTETLSCTKGCSVNSQTHLAECTTPKGNICSDAINVDISGGKVTINNNLQDYKSTYTPNEPNNRNCMMYSGSGRDVVYHLNGPAYGIVTVSLDITNGSGDTTLYAVDSCITLEELSEPGSSAQCLSGDDKNSGTETIKVPLSATGEAIVVVDESSRNQSGTLEYTITFDKPTAPKCKPPGSTSCDQATETYKVCADYGRKVYSADCLLGCKNSTECKPENNDRCDATQIPVLQANREYVGRIDIKTDSYNAYGCKEKDGNSINEDYFGPDAYFKLTGKEGDYVDVTVEVVADEDNNKPEIVAGFLQACGTRCEEAVHLSGFTTTNTLSHIIPPSGEIILVIDSKKAHSAGKYKISYTTRKAECKAEIDYCDTTDSTTYECTRLGKKGDVIAHCGTLGCDSGLRGCNRIPTRNDTCSTAFEVDMNSSQVGKEVIFTDNLANFTPDIDPGAASKCVKQELRYSGISYKDVPGKDAIYLVKAPEGKILKLALNKVKVPKDDRQLLALYTTSDCSDIANKCLLGEISSLNIENKKIYITHELSTNGIYVIVDTINDAIKYDIHFTLEEPECEPGQKSCVDATQKLCNNAGEWETSTCSLKCNANTQLCNVTENTTCNKAIEVTQSGVYIGDFSTIGTGNPTYDSANSCDSTNRSNRVSGEGAYYLVKGNEGDIIEVWGTAFNDNNPRQISNLYLYAAEDCTKADSHECIAEQGGGINHLTVKIPQGKSEVVIGVDNTKSYVATYRTPYQLVFDIYKPVCNENTCISPDTLTKCINNGKETKTLHCHSGCDSSGKNCIIANNSCNDNGIPTIPTNMTYLFEGDLNDYTSELTPSGCTGATNGSGKDAIFQFHLTPQQKFVANLTAETGDKLLWITDGCSASSASCLKSAKISSSSKDGHIEFTSTTGGDYYLIVDSKASSTSSDDLFTLTASISYLCTQNTTECIGDTLVTCDANHNEIKQECLAGCQKGASVNNSHCKDVINTTCGTATEILTTDNTFTSKGTYNKAFGDDYSKGINCYKENNTGGDIVYKVSLQDGETLTAHLDSTKTDGILAITENCTNLTYSGDGSCLSGAIGKDITVSYTAVGQKTVYLIVDHKNQYLSGSFSLKAMKNNGFDCGNKPAQCNNGIFNYCDKSGIFYNDYECQTGKCNTSGTACEKPTGDFITDPIPLTAGEHIVVKGGNHLNSFDAPAGSYNSNKCTTTNALNGNEYIYKIEVPAGKKLSIPYQTKDENVVMILLDDSVNIDKCLTMETGSRRGVVKYDNTSGSTKTLYLILDNYGTFTSSNEIEFSLHIGD